MKTIIVCAQGRGSHNGPMHRTPVTLGSASLQSHMELRIQEKLVTQLLAACFTITNLVLCLPPHLDQHYQLSDLPQSVGTKQYHLFLSQF